VSEVRDYVTSPLRWDGRDWLYFGGALAAIGLAHHYDADVRRQYAPATPPSSNNSHDLQDIAPTAALLAGTLGLAQLSDDSAGKKEGWAMLEAATFSAGTSYALKFAAGREAPYQTSDPDLFRRGGSSFPSLHTTVAFAVGTVMAESGNDDYRWLRRALGYGVGVFTSYERLKHNQHWLSDTVAGAAIGASTALFAMRHLHDSEESASGLSVVPEAGGAMLTYRRSF
jgi:hypothetical protein